MSAAELWPGCVAPTSDDVVEVDPAEVAALEDAELRELARALGVLLDDEPTPEVIRTRIQRCQA